MTLPAWVVVLQALLTPVIGITTAYIAWRQWRGARYRLRMDQYERRLRIYQAVVAFIPLVVRDFKPTVQDIMQFPPKTAEAAFLFDKDIPDYIDEMFKRALELHAAHADYRDMFQPFKPNEPDQAKVVAKITATEEWFGKQITVAKDKFKKYLYLNRP